MAQIPGGIFKSYDIRGTVPEEINEENIYHITQAVLSFFETKTGKKNLTIVTGRDMRISAPTLYPIFKKALTDAGAHVLDVGLVATPTFYFGVIHLKADAGIQLTASHNPPNYNGIKIVMRNGTKILKVGGGSGMEVIKNNALENVHLSGEGGDEKQINNIVYEELKNAYTIVSPKEIKSLRVVADSGNAMASTYIEPLFKDLPGDLVKMNFELDGTFPAHQPDPLIYENYTDLMKRVVQEKADFGIAPDGDGDRVFFVDEKGHMVPASMITALVAKELLKKYPGERILYDIRYVMTPKKIIEECGGVSSITRVGHAHITNQMNQENGLFGGESSGHMFLRATGGAESQVTIILLVAKAISDSGKPLSTIIEDLRRSYESGEFNFKTDKAAEILKALQKQYSDARISKLDGISIEYDNWRFNVRTSNTEPLLRLNLEAKTNELVQKKLVDVKSFIIGHGAIPYTP